MAELIPWARNSRVHSDAQVAELAGSIKQFGWTNPVLIAEDDILAGHARVLAARKLGIETVPCIDLSHLSDGQRRAYVIADNRLAEKATWDFEMLAAELDELAALEFDLDFTGFDASDRERVERKATASSGNRSQAGENELEEITEQPVTEAGDLWTVGSHRLYCGDTTQAESFDILLEGGKAMLVVTSPPYNQKLDTFRPSGMQTENPSFVNRMAAAYFDNLPEPEYQAQQNAVLGLILANVESHASLFYNHKIRYREKQIVHPLEWINDSGWRVRQEIVWERPGSITLNARMFMPRDERIYWLTAGDAFVFNDDTEIKSWSSVWQIPPTLDTQVSAPFPVELPRRCILACTNEGDLVVDPYAGVGTTLIAADQLDRTFAGIEINPAYVDATLARFQRLRSGTPRLEPSGLTFDEVAAKRHDERTNQ